MIELSATIVKLPLVRSLRFARAEMDSVEVVEIILTDPASGTIGFGEARPDPRRGETAAGTLEFLLDCRALLGDDAFALEAIGARLKERPGHESAKSGIDAALHDLCGKLLGIPLWRMLGLERLGPPTLGTVWLDEPEEMAHHATEVARRFRRIKVKLGGRDGLDAERLCAVRRVTALPLTVDANEAWSFDQAVQMLPLLAELGVELCEQPLPAGDPDGPELKRRSPVPVYADEECRTLEDLVACARTAHGINVKLQKAGGAREAVRMVHAARALGLGVMLGCTAASALGLAPSCHVASLFDYVDLDGNLLLAEDPWKGLHFLDGTQVPGTGPGLAVRRAGP